MCESVTPHTKAFELHLRNTGKNQRQVGKVMSLMAVRCIDGKQQGLIRYGSRGQKGENRAKIF